MMIVKTLQVLCSHLKKTREKEVNPVDIAGQHRILLAI